MILLVNDANILIDLLKIDLMDAFFQLKYEFHVTDLVVKEVIEDNVSEMHSYIENGRLHKKSFSFEELMEIQSLKTAHKALSIPDCSCLFHAGQLSARLLTGEAALRKIAGENNIRVHGILWILDQLVGQEVITKKQAHDKLSELKKINPRLPARECDKRLRKWRTQ